MRPRGRRGRGWSVGGAGGVGGGAGGVGGGVGAGVGPPGFPRPRPPCSPHPGAHTRTHSSSSPQAGRRGGSLSVPQGPRSLLQPGIGFLSAPPVCARLAACGPPFKARAPGRDFGLAWVPGAPGTPGLPRPGLPLPRGRAPKTQRVGVGARRTGPGSACWRVLRGRVSPTFLLGIAFLRSRLQGPAWAGPGPVDFPVQGRAVGGAEALPEPAPGRERAGCFWGMPGVPTSSQNQEE